MRHQKETVEKFRQMVNSCNICQRESKNSENCECKPESHDRTAWLRVNTCNPTCPARDSGACPSNIANKLETSNIGECDLYPDNMDDQQVAGAYGSGSKELKGFFVTLARHSSQKNNNTRKDKLCCRSHINTSAGEPPIAQERTRRVRNKPINSSFVTPQLLHDGNKRVTVFTPPVCGRA